MKISLPKFSQVTATAVVIAMAISSTVSAQTNDVDELYQSNAELPLGGFFAKEFTRTFTLMGGWNSLSADLPVSTFNRPPQDSPASFFSREDATIGLQDPDFNQASERQKFGETGYAFSVAMGRRHNHRLRSEFEFAVRENEVTRQFPGFVTNDILADVRAYSLMKNVIFELPNQTQFTPYGGVGIGVSWIDVNGTTTTFADTDTTSALSEGDAAFTYQAIVGVSTRLNPLTDFVVEYRFLGTTGVEVAPLDNAPYQANNLFLGLKLEY